MSPARIVAVRAARGAPPRAVLAGGERRLLLDVRRLAASVGDAARQIVSGAATERRDHSS